MPVHVESHLHQRYCLPSILHTAGATANSPIVPASSPLQLGVRHRRDDRAQQRRDDDMQERIKHHGVHERRKVVRQVWQPEFVCERLREGPEEGVRVVQEVVGHGDSSTASESSEGKGATTDVEGEEEVEGVGRGGIPTMSWPSVARPRTLYVFIICEF